jgi:hypothetical protein
MPLSCRDAERAGPVSALCGLMHRFIPPRERIERSSATRRFVQGDAWVEIRVVRLAAQQLKIAGRVRGNLPK